MKKYFISADIHGFYDEWKLALKESGFDINNENHIVVVCGDLMDRGKQPLECLNFVNDLYDKHRAILVRGNHEDLIEEAIHRGYFMQHDQHNGTIDTVLKLTKHCRDEINGTYSALNDIQFCDAYKKYINNLVDYALIGEKYICVHGWIPCKCFQKGFVTNDIHYEKVKDWKHGNWSTARWINGMAAWEQGAKINGKTIICGHYHSSWGHHHISCICSEWGSDAIFDPFIDNGIIALDACTAYSHKVNCIVIEI